MTVARCLVVAQRVILEKISHMKREREDLDPRRLC